MGGVRQPRQTDDYIETDPVAMVNAEAALREMGRPDCLSALLLDGPPGTGKTKLSKHLAGRLGARLVMFPCHEGLSHHEMLAERLPDGSVAEGVLPRAARMSAEGPVVLLLDEMDKAEPSCDAFLLTFLQDNLLSDPRFGEVHADPSRFLLCMTKNDRRDLGAALLRRCRCVRTRWPAPEVEKAILRQMAPGAAPKLLDELVAISGRLRAHPQIQKKPSTPELGRLARDLVFAVAEGRDPLLLGHYALNAMLFLEADRRHFAENPLFVGQSLLEACGG